MAPSDSNPSALRARRRCRRPGRFHVARLAVALAALFAAAAARGLGPHEIVLLVNANSPDSREIANHYAKLRGVPLENLIHLDVPADFGGDMSMISTQQFEQLIWTPAVAAVARRNIADHILAWVYSSGFPVMIDAPKQVSLHGMTFVRGNLPAPEAIDKAGFASRLFRGPAAPAAPRGPSLSLEQFAMTLGTNLPLSSMSIGHVAPRGLPVRETIESLRFAVRSDCTRPDGAVNFVTGGDVRATARAWQPATVADELAKLGVPLVVTTNEPDRTRGLIGLQAGLADIDRFLDARLLPGSMAEHLTSFGAVFANDSQSKIVKWIRAGAAGSAGTVTEPYALWPKFPHTRFFVHYASGCTMLESFQQALASPLQIFLLGDPLARPYGRAQPLTLICLTNNDEAVTGEVEFMVTGPSGVAPQGLSLLYLLDGRSLAEAGRGTRAKLDTTKLDDGWHELRAVGYSAGNVKQQGFSTKRFAVRNRGRSVTMAPGVKLRLDPATPLEIRLEATGDAARFEILAQGRPVAAGAGPVLQADLAGAGPGPVWLQPVAHYPDGGVARGRPLLVEVNKTSP